VKPGSGIPGPVHAVNQAVHDPKFCRSYASSEVVYRFVGENPDGEIGDDKEDEI
jgi:hypothetical protein